MFNPANIVAYSYVRDYWKKTPNSYKKISIGLVVSGVAIAGIITAATCIASPPLLVNILTAILVPLALYFLYNLYNLFKTIYKQYYIKEEKVEDKGLNIIALDRSTESVKIVQCYERIELLPDDVPEQVKIDLKGLAMQNSQRAFELATTVQKIDLIFKNLSQPTNDRFYKSLMDLVLINSQEAHSIAKWLKRNDVLLNRVKQCTESEHYECVIDLSFANREKAHALSTLIVKVNNQFNKIRQSTRDKFFDPIIELAYTNRDDALVLATVVKEIDGIVSGITNKDLLDYFDQFFTFTEIQHVHERTKVIAFARKCKEIDDANITDNEKKPLAVQAKLHPEIPLPEGITKPTEVVSYLEITSSYAEKALSTAKSWISFVGDARNSIQDGVRSNCFVH